MSLPALPELTENFAMFDDWEDRYRYLLDLGKQLEAMPDELKTEHAEVKGCVSKVWMVTTILPDARLHFLADSDGLITKGLIAILLSAYQDKTREEIAAVDIEEAFHTIGLSQHLTPNRRNGFFAMVERVRSQGRAA